MKTFAVLTAACAVVLGLAGAAPAQTPATSPVYGCAKPQPPVFPAPAAAANLQAAEIDQARYARDSYFAAADQNLACLDADIEARMRSLFATGAAMDPTLRAAGVAHEQASRERAETHERFLRMCLAYEDAKGPVSGGCR
ncbi:MAG: hypothetical protein SGJ23_06840 [Alphaproteobacteria bacterium]|nr:hypothetical protein [Alphaproteobacteria bacterium]